jgi:glycerol kinase
MLLNTGSAPVQSKAGLLTTLCYTLGEEPQYALEGAVEAAGVSIEWAKKNMGLFNDFDEF